MQKNVKSIFLVATLLFLLVGVSAISASEVSNDNTIIQDTADTVVPEATTTTTDNKIVDTPTKNIKTEEQSTDLYVSDTSGSDDNSGTNTSPYKTIQKALDTTTADSTYNIHIAEGTYKGLGNTNLTVNGNYNINIIGSSNTIIDGEAKYDMKTELLPGEYYWESSPEWYPFQNVSGNYAMNITTGTGTIKLTNLTIQNCYSEGIDGGDSINKYPFTTVDNYANLIVNNVSFIDNCAGVGAAIRNNHDSTLTVQNSNFTGNRKSTSSGNDGGAIYNNGTATITGSIFNDNWSRWGTILNDGQLTITDSRISNNHAYDGTSTYKYGAGIAADSGKADFFNPYTITGIETTIENCTFENNGQSDVYHGDGILIINNSTFKNSTGIYIATNDTNSQQTVTNNQILDIKGSSLFSSLSVTTDTTFAIYQYLSPNTLITNNTITGKVGNAIILNSNATVTNNNMTLPITVRGNNTLIENNTINTTAVYAVNVAAPTFNNSVINNTLESSLLYGNKAVNATRITVEDNTPELGQDITITDETYYQYFYENSSIIPDTIEAGSIVTLSGNFYNKSFTIDDLRLTIKSTGTIFNGTITVRNNSRINAEGININNINTSDEYAILLESDANILSGVDININTVNPVHAIIIKGDYNELSITASVFAPSNPITREDNLADSMILDIQSSNNIITHSRLALYSNSNNTDGVLVGINIESLDKTAQNNTLFEVGTTVQYGDYVYGIRIINSTNNILNRQQSSFQWDTRAEYATKDANGIYIAGKSDNNKILQTNTMYTSKYNEKNDYNVYSIVINGSQEKINNTYINNTYYASILIINATNTQINNNTASNNINNFTNIMILNSENVVVNNTVINLPDKNITGMLIQDSVNIGIYNSTIKTDKTIVINNSVKTIITDNYLFINETDGGDETIEIINSIENTIENNTPVILKLTNDNYNKYFDENSIYNQTSDLILLASDLYNKNITISTKVTFLNLNNYTIYNGTLTLIENSAGSNITGLNFYSNDERTNIIYLNVSNTYIDHATIYQENHENIVKTIIIEDEMKYTGLRWANIHVLGPEIQTEDNTPSTLVITRGSGNQNLLSTSNITVESTKTDNLGHITAIYSNTNTDSGSTLNYANTHINMTGNNIIVIEDTRINTNGVNITLQAKNNATILKLKNPITLIFRNNNYNITCENNLVVYDIENPNVFSSDLSGITMNINAPNILIANITNWTMGSVMIYGNLNLTTENITLLKAKDTKAGTSMTIPNLTTENITIIDADNSTITFTSNNINATVTNNNGIKIINNSNLTTYDYFNGNEININQTNPSTTITIINSIADIQKSNITQNTTNTPIIHSNNSNITVTNNYLETIDMTGDNAVEIIDSIAIIEENTPSQTGYKSFINFEIIQIPENKTTPIPIIVTNTFGEPIEGTITASLNGKPVTVENNIAYVTATKETFNSPTATFTTNIENQVITSPMRLQTSTSINNTTFEVPNQAIPSASNSIATWSNQIYLINNTILNAPIYVRSPTYIYNSTLNGTYRATTAGILYVDDDTIIGENFRFYSTDVKIFTNNKQLLTILQQNNILPLNSPTLTVTYTDSTGKYNSSSMTKTLTLTPITLTVDSIMATVGDVINITARITAGDDTLTDINKGKVTFKVNGKTLKDTNGKVIYAKVINGVAKIENYLVPDDWAKEGTTIEAIYSGSTQCEKLTSEKTEINIEKAVPTLTTSDVTAAAGETITLTATITDNDKVINNGKVVFKINGKTVKDENGKVIYAKVVNNQVSVEYTLPADMKAKDYNITATFISSDYERIEDTKTLTITA